MMLNRFVVVDLETTGNSPKKGDKIIQLAAVVIENDKIIDTFSSLINPCQPIPVFIEELTGINDDMVEDAPLFADIAPRVASLLENSFFVAHNVFFDMSFLQEELTKAGHERFCGPVIDTVELARIFLPTSDGFKLSDLAEREKLKHDRPHQADSDAMVTAELLLIFLKKAAQLPHKTLNSLAQLAGGLKSDLQQLFNELLLIKERAIENLPETMETYNGLVIKKFPLVSNTAKDREKYPFPESEQEKGAILQKAFPFYEYRSGQFSIMDGVYQAFQQNTHTLIEAGTGVGKSIGYLLPAAYFSQQTGLPVVISTHTIQLQEQLMLKEIPLLKKLVPFQINAILLKGKEHYLSLERFRQSLLDENDNYDTTLTKMQILVWLLETETGDKDELNLSSGGQIFWNKINNTYTAAKGKRDLREKDFYFKAKDSAAHANVIITNHSLMLSDLAARHSILPDYEYAVIDEGHHFEKTAAHFCGRSLDYMNVRLLLSKIGLYEQQQLFFELEKLIDSLQTDKSSLIHTDELNRMISELIFEMEEFFKLTSSFAQQSVIKKRGLQRLKVRFTRHRKESTAMVYSAERFSFLLKDIAENFNERINLLDREAGSLTSLQKAIMKEWHSLQEEIAEARQNVKDVMLDDSDFAKWIEIDLRAPQNVTTIRMQPASVADYLEADFFQKKKSIVITSATLTVNNSFRYIRKELGLKEEPITEIIIPSPFDFRRKVRLLIPEDLPEINSVSLDDYVTAITEHIITIAEATKGRMLLLFTSHEMLKKTYELIKESGFLSDYAIIAQGITGGSQTRLTRNFQRYEKAILLGTSSFWEGIDIPGEDLSCLVIVRLPFSPPDEPYTEAKVEYVKKQGGNAFSDYALPEAILRFKQGFGRLIRSENDRGVIVVLDKRIVSTRYGKEFIKSIPVVQITKGSIALLVDSIKQWLW